MLDVEGLPVHVVVGATVVTVPFVVVRKVMGRAVAACMFVGVGYAAARFVIALGVGAGAVLVVVGMASTPHAILQCGALEVLVVGIELLALAAVDRMGKGAAVGTVTWSGFVVKLGHVDDPYVVLQAQLSGNVQGDVGEWWGVRRLIVGVPDKGRTCEVRVETCHSAAVMKAVLDLLMTKSPEFLFALELNFTQADGLFLGY